MKHDLEKLRRRLSAESRGIAERLAALPADADAPELRRAELLLRDLVANARAARNLIEQAQVQEGVSA